MIWLEKAKSYIGEKEIPGKLHNLKILGWWKAIKSVFTDDETPWCAAFVGGVLEECSIRSSRSAAARSYLSWGVKLSGPAVGAVVVFWRGSPSASSGHVGFIVGKDRFNNLVVLGGNQGNKVCLLSFSEARVLGYRWPIAQALPTETRFFKLPLITNQYEISINES